MPAPTTNETVWQELLTLACISHQHSTAEWKGATRTASHSVGLLNVPCSTSALASVVRLVTTSPSPRSSICPLKPHPRDSAYYPDRFLGQLWL
jgi:hypothetical protein